MADTAAIGERLATQPCATDEDAVAQFLAADPLLQDVETQALRVDEERALFRADLSACLRVMGADGAAPTAAAMRAYLRRLGGVVGTIAYADAHNAFVHQCGNAVATKLINLIDAEVLVRNVYESISRRTDSVQCLVDDLTAFLKVFGLETFDAHAQRVIEYLISLQIDLMRSHLAPDRASVAFFCPTRAFRGHFGRIPELLEEQGNTVFYLYGERHGDDFEAHETSFFVGGDVIGRLDFIDAFVVPSIMDCLPDRSIKILVDHLSFAVFDPNEKTTRESGIAETARPRERQRSYEDLVNEYTHAVAFFPLFDYLVAPSKIIYDMAVERARFFGMTPAGESDAGAPAPHPDAAALLEGLKGKTLAPRPCIVPGGYPKLDANIRYAEAAGPPEKIITYAPTPNDAHANKTAWADYMSVNTAGKDILITLARAFPDYQVVFKPYADEFPEVVESIVAATRDLPNVALDQSGSQYIGLYSRTALLVSDFSSTAYSFAFATLRPVLFYSVNEAKVQELVAARGGDRYCEHRSRLGLIALDPGELVVKARRLLDEPDHFAGEIRRLRNESCFHVGACERYIADNFPPMLERRRNPEWRYFDRRMEAQRAPNFA